jgi:hypothetical protein
LSKSNYLEEAILNWMKGTTFPAAPTNVYIALYTSDPTDADSGTEVTGGSYARATFAVGDWSSITQPGGAATISNDVAIAFPTATDNWGTVTHFGVRSASSGGNLFYHGSLSTPRTILNGDPTPTFASGALVISEQ